MKWLWLVGKLGLAGFVLCLGVVIASTFWWRGKTLPPDIEADVIVVLGAGLDPQSGHLSAYGRERVITAAQLYHAGHATHMIISGGDTNPALARAADEMLQLALDRNVPRNAILMERNSRTTLQNAEFTASLMNDFGLQTAILVTDGFHLNRARLLFAYFDVNIIAFSPSNGLFSTRWPKRLKVLLRETLAYPVNAARIAAHWIKHRQ